MIFALLDEAVANHARISKACEVIGVSARMVERWRKLELEGKYEDQRFVPNTEPANKMSPAERKTILKVINSRRYCDMSANQIVPLLADAGLYIGSESTIHRVMREEKLLVHRGPCKGITAARHECTRGNWTEPGVELGHKCAAASGIGDERIGNWDGLSQPACRSRLQTTASGLGQKPRS